MQCDFRSSSDNGNVGRRLAPASRPYQRTPSRVEAASTIARRVQFRGSLCDFCRFYSEFPATALILMRVGIEPRQEHWSVCGVYTEVQVRYRIILPILFGSLAIALVIWDIHNLRVIQSNGMSWDTGAPIWPYEAANLIFSSLNAPAFVLAAPFFYFPHLELQEMRYPVLLPAIVVWWWWIGTRFDFGILGLRRWSHPRWWAAGAITLAVVFSVAGAWSVKDGIERWIRFPDTHPLILAKISSIAAWCFAIAVGCSLAVRRLWHREFSSADGQSRHRPVLAYGIGLTALAALATSLVGMIQEPKLDRNSCIVDDSSGCVHGTVIDAAGNQSEDLKSRSYPQTIVMKRDGPPSEPSSRIARVGSVLIALSRASM